MTRKNMRWGTSKSWQASESMHDMLRDLDLDVEVGRTASYHEADFLRFMAEVVRQSGLPLEGVVQEALAAFEATIETGGEVPAAIKDRLQAYFTESAIEANRLSTEYYRRSESWTVDDATAEYEAEMRRDAAQNVLRLLQGLDAPATCRLQCVEMHCYFLAFALGHAQETLATRSGAAPIEGGRDRWKAIVNRIEEGQVAMLKSMVPNPYTVATSAV